MTIASRSQSKLDAALAELGADACAVVLDTGDEAAVERFFAEEAPWDHIVVSAAQTPSGPVRTLSLADAKAAMDSKFWGAYHVARAAKIQETGSLTFVSGFLSVRPSAPRCFRVRSTLRWKRSPAAWRWNWRRCASTPSPPV